MSRSRRNGFHSLVDLVARLRSQGGCPWDRAQTHRSLVRFLREEAAELSRALRRGRASEIADELGDLLYHIVLHARIAEEGGRFDIDDVARGQVLKLRRRHPHVFGGGPRFKTAGEVVRHWRRLKRDERRLRSRDLRRRSRTPSR